MARVAEVLAADGTATTLDIPGVPLHQSEYWPDMTNQYESSHRPLASRFGLYERAMQLKVWHRDDLWPDRADFYGSTYYHEVVVPQRAFDTVAVTVRTLAGAPAIVYAMHATPNGRKFGQRGMALLRLLRPAFKSGVRTVEFQTGGPESLISRLETEQVAARVFSAGGALLHQTAPMAVLTQLDDHGTLQRAIQEVAGDVQRVAFPVQGKAEGNGRPAAVSRSVVHGGRIRSVTGMLCIENHWGRTFIVVSVLDEGRDEGSATLRRYRLTPQESTVAQMLCERLTNTEIAERLGIAEHTARHHTESVLSKLGVRSRRDVARILRDSGTQ